MTTRRVAIVTGASSGIGMHTALAFAKRGYAVVLAARRLEKLQEVAEACQAAGSRDAPLVVPTDVADRQQVQAMVNKAVEKFGRIDVMVNNAGFGQFGRVHELSDEQIRAIFDVNFFGVFYGCKAVVPVMRRQRSGHIFNVSSVIGKRATPFHGAYCATKFAVIGLTEALRVEMAPFNVRVTCVCPALTATEFFEKSRGGRSTQSRYVRPESMTQPEKVARKIARTVGRRKPELVFTAGGRFLAVLGALWPAAADRIMKFYYIDLAKKRLSGDGD